MTPKAPMPQWMPVLSRGKHRNPHRGACFMEMASFLAGERWSDHPRCTHPLLAQLARLVNDTVTDRVRPQLIPMIPSVIGLNGDDLRCDAAIVLRSATAALPIAAESRQHVLAMSILRCEGILAGLDGSDPTSLSPQSRQALDDVPAAEAWARSFAGGPEVSSKTFRAKVAPHILNLAVEGIAQACAPDVEQRLVDLLADTVADCEQWATGAAAKDLPAAGHAEPAGRPMSRTT